MFLYTKQMDFCEIVSVSQAECRDAATFPVSVQTAVRCYCFVPPAADYARLRPVPIPADAVRQAAAVLRFPDQWRAVRLGIAR